MTGVSDVLTEELWCGLDREMRSEAKSPSVSRRYSPTCFTLAEFLPGVIVVIIICKIIDFH